MSESTPTLEPKATILDAYGEWGEMIVQKYPYVILVRDCTPEKLVETIIWARERFGYSADLSAEHKTRESQSVWCRLNGYFMFANQVHGVDFKVRWG